MPFITNVGSVDEEIRLCKVMVFIVAWPLMLLLLVRGDRRGFISSVIAFSLGVVLPMLLMGKGVWLEFINQALPVLGQWSITSAINVSLGGYLHHLTSVFAEDLVSKTSFYYSFFYIFPLTIAALTALFSAQRINETKDLDFAVSLTALMSFLSSAVAKTTIARTNKPRSLVFVRKFMPRSTPLISKE